MNSKDIFENTVRSAFAGVAWSHKIHEKQADLYSTQYKKMEVVKIASSVLTSIGIISMIVTDPLWLKIVSACISGISAFISTYYQTFKTYEQIELQKKTARELLALRDKYIYLLLSIKVSEKRIEELMIQFEQLEETKHSIYNSAPITSDKSVELARIALRISHDNGYSDEEIDAMLPESLRKGETHVS